MKFRVILLLCLVLVFISGASEKAVGAFNLKKAGQMARYPVELTAKIEQDVFVFSAILQHPDVMGIKCSAQERNRNSWEDESLELFILPAGAGEEEYLHIAVNADGVVFAERGTSGPQNFNSEGIEAITRKSRENGCWELTLRLPLHYLGSRNSQKAIYGFNFVRSVQLDGKTVEISSWSKLELGAHEPYNFGKLEINGGKVRFIPKDKPLLRSAWNGGFEQKLENWRPMAWVGGDHYGEGQFSHEITDKSIEGNWALRINGKKLGRPKMEGARMGFVSAPVRLQPGKYSLTGYYKCIPGDFVPIDGMLVSVYASGGKSEIFLPASSGWRHFDCRFELQEAKDIGVMLRLWTNGSVWFDAISIDPAPVVESEEKLPELSTEKVVDGVRFEILQYPQEPLSGSVATAAKEQGVLLYQREIEKLQPDSVPSQSELIDSLKIRALPGMSGVEFIMLYGNGSWRVSTGNDWLQVSRVPFWLQRTGYDNHQAKWVAEVLYPMTSGEVLAVSPDQAGVLALSWRVPRDAAPGNYQMELQLTDKENSFRMVSLPVSISISGRPPAESTVEFGLWIAPNHIPQVLPYLLDGQVKTASFPLPLKVSCDSDGGNVRVDLSAAVERLRKYEESGMVFPVPAEMSTLSTDLARAMGIYDKLPRDATFDSRHLICPANINEYPPELTRAFRSAVRSIYDQLNAAGFGGKILYYITDEPTSNPHRMFKAAHEGAIAKEECPGIEVFMTAHDLVRTERLAKAGALDIVCLSLGILAANPEWAVRFYEMAERNKLKIWAYTGSTGESYATTRRLGFLTGKEHIDRLMMWVSYFDNADPSDPLNDLKGPLKRVATFYPSSSGYRSTIQWEGVKDAMSDLRILQAVRIKIKELPQKEAALLSGEIERELSELVSERVFTRATSDKLRNRLLDILGK